MYRGIKETEIEKQQYKREFFKELKKRKIFGKFCLAVAEAYSPTYEEDVFGEKTYQFNPKRKAEDYIIKNTKIDEYFFHSVKDLWDVKPKILIQP